MSLKGVENMEVFLMNYIFGSIKYIKMTERECHYIKNERNQCHLMRDRDLVESYLKNSRKVGATDLPVMWSHPDVLELVTRRWNDIWMVTYGQNHEN